VALPLEGTGPLRTLAAVPNLDAMFAARLRQRVGGALETTRGTVLFDAPPAGRWTVVLREGAVTVQRGAPRRPTASISADPSVMAAMLEGTVSGVEAYLAGQLVVRGSLALALQVDGAFDVGERPASHPRAKVCRITGGVRTAYLEAGPADAPPVILMHGLGATNASMLPILVDLARDHRVLAPDLPGFGASGAPRWQYHAAEFAAWLEAFQGELGARPAALIGNSLGGRIAIEAGLSHPESVTGMALLCPSPAFRRLRQLAPVVRVLSPELAAFPLPLSHRVIVETIRLMFAQPDRLPRHWYDAGADEHKRVMQGAAHRRAFLAAMRQIYLEEAHGERGFWDRLPYLDVPALFVWGARDRLVPAAFERHVVSAVPGARSVVLDDCGHVPQFELPERTNALIRELLDSL
jgi:pimeloyl-ACP methyl ester carboxylesterase